MLGLRFCAKAFSSCGKRGPLFIAVRGPLTIAASLVAEHRLQTRRLSNCGSRAQLLRGMWDPPRPGLEPCTLHWQADSQPLHHQGSPRLMNLKMTVLPKVFYKCNRIPIKISMAIFAVIENIMLKFIGNLKGPQKAKILLEKKMEAIIFRFQNILQSNQDDVVLAETQIHKTMEQIRIPAILLGIYEKCIDMDAKTVQQGKESLNNKWC